MRWAFWRKGEERAQVDQIAARPAPVAVRAAATPPAGDIDLRALADALKRRRKFIIVPTVLVAVLSLVIVNLVTPRYKSESRILIGGPENVFLRPNSEANQQRAALDPEAVTSQVQLVLSRDLALQVIRKNKLAELPEFDPALRGVARLKWVLSLFGIVRNPFSMTPEERVLDAYFDRLTAFAVDKSRVIVVQFESCDPALAARVANSIARGYLVLQRDSRQQEAKTASRWLAGEIDTLRKKVADAEARVAGFRSKANLFTGPNNTTLSSQQLGELNTQLNNARALKADAEAKARLIRQMLQSGKPIETSAVLNSELIRRLSEQRVLLQAQLAEQSETLLPKHPHIRELKAQLADLDHQIRDEAVKIARSLENDARLAGDRVDSLAATLDQMKKQASSSSSDDIRLRALERDAKADRDLFQTYLAKYREATTRETIDASPSDARIISPSIVSNTPAYPKKLPIFLIATLATLMLSAGVVVTGELLRMTAPGAFASEFPAAAPTSDTSLASASLPAADPAPTLAPPADDPPPDAPASPDEIERLADELRKAGEAAHKITVLGTAGGESVPLTALVLARRMARDARVVLVDLASSVATVSPISVDPTAPGLAELVQGEASFSQVITRDSASRLQLVSAGRPGFDPSLLQSPRLTLAIDALLRVYDHVLLDAGLGSDLPADLLTANARAIVVPAAAMDEDARKVMCEQLTAVGFAEVTMLKEPAPPLEAREPGPQV
ncbi:MAG: GumC family protein, partial [Bradyrhizobium sp.]